jgi:hypothetical protein
VATAKDLVVTSLKKYREVVDIQETPTSVVVTLDMRMLNLHLERFLETVQKVVRSRFGMGLVVAARQDDQQHWDPNFEHMPGVGALRVPTIVDENIRFGLYKKKE